MKREVNVDRRQHCFSVLGRVDEMRRDKQYCDFLIKVDSEEIHAHRNILAGGSDYFHAMFSHDTKENKSGVVEMLGVDPECAIICIDHIYGGKIFVPDGKDEEMMHAAVLMQLHTLRDAIASLLEEDLNPKSFFVTKKIAIMFGCKKLEEKCEEFAGRNFYAISKEDGFVELEKNYIKRVMKSDSTKATESEKLDASLRWIKYDTERRKCTMEMLECVDLAQIPAGNRRYLIEHEPVINEDKNCLLHFSVSLLDSLKVKSEKFTPDSTNKSAVVLVFDEISGHLQRFNPRDESWVTMQKMNGRMKSDWFTAIELDDHIYVLMKNQSVFRLQHLDKTATWERMADMLEQHGDGPPVVTLEGFIFVIGGHDHFSTKTCERFHPASNHWGKVKDRRLSSAGSAVLALQRYIYTFGGHVNGKYDNQVVRLNPTSGEWVDLAPLQEVKAYISAAELCGKIYVLGGYNGSLELKTAECYDIKKNQWTFLSPMLRTREWLRTFVIDGTLFAVGGVRSLNSIEKYEFENNEWKMVELPADMKLHINESVQIKMAY